MAQLSRTLVICALDLRRRVRNRSAVITTVVGPLAMAIVFGLLVSGTSELTVRIGVVDLDRSAASMSLVSSLLADDGSEAADGDPGGAAAQQVLQFVELDPGGAALDGVRNAVADGTVDAALVLEAGFGAAATAGGSGSLVVVQDPEQVVSGQIAASVAQSVAAGYRQVGLSVATVMALAGTGSGAFDEALIDAAGAQSPALSVQEVPVGGRDLSAAAFYGAGMSILFLFFTVGFAARSVLAEREAGTLDRVLATPTTAGAVIAGKTLSVGVLGVAGFVVVWLVTSVLFDAPWGDPIAVSVLIVSTVFAIAGVATFVASLARTERQADAATAAVTFLLALLGGNFVGPNQPPLLRRLSVLTPNGWSLRAFADLNADAATLSSIATAVSVLLVMGAVFGSIGVRRVRSVMVR
ncbi:MAG: ABC transporter permease [Acidimicrobiales bacterium]|nr:ABC transporter permease [Acidimicrobiales bacterium]